MSRPASALLAISAAALSTGCDLGPNGCTLDGPCCPEYTVAEAEARVGIEAGEAVRAWDRLPFGTDAGEIEFFLTRRRVKTHYEVVDDECSPTLAINVGTTVSIDDERIGGLDGRLDVGFAHVFLSASRPTRVEGHACDCQTELRASLEGEPFPGFDEGERGHVVVRCPIDERFDDCSIVSGSASGDVVEVLAAW